MQRPPFWRVPKNKPDPDEGKPGYWTLHEAKVGSPSEGELRSGDVIRKIGDRDARTLSHDQAQNLIKNAGNTITFALERESSSSCISKSISTTSMTSTSTLIDPVATLPRSPIAGGVATPFARAAQAPKSPLKVNTAAAPMVNHSILSPKSPGINHFAKPLPSPSQNAVTVFPPPLPNFEPTSGQPLRPYTPSMSPLLDGLAAPEAIDNQPYRTTPLVLPGAKNKKEVPITSYLRHHPNPSVRAPPHHHFENVDVLMKQKVADTVLERVVGADTNKKLQVVHQFNSPIGLYSDQNIAETVQATHTGVTPHHPRVRFATLPTRKSTSTLQSCKAKKTLYYDPSKSETFKALKESELGDTITEVPTPIQPKVFTPQKHIQPPINQMQRPQAPRSPQPVNNFYPLADEKIHQSYSFRRLMNEVLGESDF